MKLYNVVELRNELGQISKDLRAGNISVQEANRRNRELKKIMKYYEDLFKKLKKEKLSDVEQKKLDHYYNNP